MNSLPTFNYNGNSAVARTADPKTATPFVGRKLKCVEGVAMSTNFDPEQPSTNPRKLKGEFLQDPISARALENESRRTVELFKELHFYNDQN